MRGSTIDEQLQGETMQHDVNFEGGEQIDIPQEPQVSPMSVVLEKLKTPTGEGMVQDYMDQPLNFGKNEHQKKAIGRMLRGLTGFLGSLDFAVIDVVIGFLDLNKGGGAHVRTGTSREPGGINS